MTVRTLTARFPAHLVIKSDELPLANDAQKEKLCGKSRVVVVQGVHELSCSATALHPGINMLQTVSVTPRRIFSSLIARPIVLPNTPSTLISSPPHRSSLPHFIARPISISPA